MSGITWTELIASLRDAFAGDSVDIGHVKDLMKQYKSDVNDWKPFAKFDRCKYTRILVDGNEDGKFNLILLCWGEGQGSCIHDHANSHCFMKILDGKLKETQFDWPSQEDVDKKKPLKENINIDYATNDVTYINDSIGIHRVENPSHTDTAVSLHLYSPPIKMCNSFDERTGNSHQCRVTFYNSSAT